MPVLVALFACALGVPKCYAADVAVGAPTADKAKKPLRISLFPYVPDAKLVEDTVRERWAARSNVPLEFVKWDGYSEDPPVDLDVFEFDAINLEYFVRNNFVGALRAEDVADAEDVLGFAWQGAMVDGVVYGVPHWGCGYILFYRKADAEVEKATGLGELYKAMGDAPATVPPEMNKGLLIDLTGGTDCASLFLDAVNDGTGRYAVRPETRSWFELSDSKGLQNLQILGRLAGKAQAMHTDETYAKRPQWFGEGRGRALVGYSERLYYIPKDKHAGIRARALPMAEKNKVNAYFMDMVGINAGLRGDRRKLAIELVNVVTEPATVLKTLRPSAKDVSSQYLLPLRASVLESKELIAEAPLYTDLAALVTPDTNPKVFRLAEDGRQWLVRNKGRIRELIYPEE